MYKVKVTVPATSTNLGPGLQVLGLALSLHTTVDLQVRSDDELKILVSGESQEAIPASFDNPALQAAIRVFQHFERAPVGLQVTINNGIPVEAGFGLRTALIVGGLVAANNLIEGGLQREDLVRLAIDLGLSQPRVVTTMFGGLSICGETDDNSLFYRNFEVVPLRVVAILPRLPLYRESISALPESVSLKAATFNASRTPLLVEALCYGAFDLLPRAVEDRLHVERLLPHIPGYDRVKQAALDAGALAVTLSGNGPVMLAFAEDYQENIAEAMEAAFARVNVETQTWTLGVDRQGVVISVFE